MTVVRITSSTAELGNQQKHRLKNITILVKELDIMLAHIWQAVRSVTDCGQSRDVGPTGLTTFSELNAKYHWTTSICPTQASVCPP